MLLTVLEDRLAVNIAGFMHNRRWQANVLEENISPLSLVYEVPLILPYTP
jgi:hypothetical protein